MYWTQAADHLVKTKKDLNKREQRDEASREVKVRRWALRPRPSRPCVSGSSCLHQLSPLFQGELSPERSAESAAAKAYFAKLLADAKTLAELLDEVRRPHCAAGCPAPAPPASPVVLTRCPSNCRRRRVCRQRTCRSCPSQRRTTSSRA